MGYFLRRFAGCETDAFDREQMLDLAEQALQLQLELARDVLEIAELSRLPDEHKVSDQRIVRARQAVGALG